MNTIDSSLNIILTDISNSENNLFQTNLNIMEILSKLTSINDSITNVDYIKNLLNTIGKKILLTYLITGNNNINKIVKNCPNLKVNINSIINNDKLFINLKNSLDKDITYKIIDNNENTDNFIVFLIDPTLKVVTFKSFALTDNEIPVNIKDYNNFDLDIILKNNINYFEVSSSKTHYKLILVNKTTIF